MYSQTLPALAGARRVAPLLFAIAVLGAVAASAHAAQIKVEVDRVKIERRMVNGANRLFVVALGNGPFKTSIGGAADKQVSTAMFGGIQVTDVSRARRAFTSRAFADGSLIFNDGAGTWTGMTIWLTDVNGDTFDAASESNANGVAVARAAGDNNAANRRLNITTPNLTKFDLNTQPNILWMRMPGASYEGALAGNPPNKSADSLCVSAPDENMTYEDLIELADDYDYLPLFDNLQICPLEASPTLVTSWGGVKAAYR